MDDDTVSASRTLSGPPRWLDAQRIRAYASFVLLVNIGFFSLRVWYGWVKPLPNVSPPGWDFAVFWSASWLALHGPAVNAFDTALIEPIVLPLQNMLPTPFVTPWTYPPTFLLVMLPAALLPFGLSCLAYVLAWIAFALQACLRILPQLRARSWWLPVVAFPAVWAAGSAGQNSFLTFGLIGFGLACVDRRPWLAGILFGLLAIKPQLGLVIPVALLCGRHWRAFVSSALTVGALCALAGLLLGFATFARFVEALPAFNHFVIQYSDRWPRGISTVFGAARHFGVAIPSAYVLHAIVAALAASAVVWLWSMRASFELRASALVLATLLVPTYLMPYDLLLLGLPILWLVRDGGRNGWIRGDGVALVSAWISPIVIYTPGDWAAAAYAPVIVLALLLVVVRRYLAQRTVRAGEWAVIVEGAGHSSSH
ncbi:glycosyltransferase family 87 protein [Paraburkholderia guartelaensis]|uniref:glycosyltransferase family 87 protein n=1 Tax=Paraburkholderia guartelaensis TaxID=2546446 RepID=UPI002AB6C81B|nr:glycosyltransferase family 87 protein [Paraburkholderia guartelaensis]